MLLGSIYLRDALIDNAASHRARGTAPSSSRLREPRWSQALTAYVPEVGSGGRARALGVAAGGAARSSGSRASSRSRTPTPRSPAQAAALLRTRVVPRRETILQVLDQLAALQTEANRRRQQEANALYSQVRLRLMSMGGATLLMALIVAVMASRHVSRLQREIERQRAAEQQNRQDLERLSARLVDAQEAERRRLARELHDEVGQALTAVKMDIGIALRSENRARVAGRARRGERARRDGAARRARSVAAPAPVDARRLRPADDAGAPISATSAHRTGIRAQLAETIDARLLPAMEVCVYRIVQEAFNNIVQHSGATACTVIAAAPRPACCGWSSTTTAAGFGPTPRPADARPGLGLIGMRERAQALGGTFAGGERVRRRHPHLGGLPLQTAAPGRGRAGAAGGVMARVANSPRRRPHGGASGPAQGARGAPRVAGRGRGGRRPRGGPAGRAAQAERGRAGRGDAAAQRHRGHAPHRASGCRRRGSSCSACIPTRPTSPRC